MKAALAAAALAAVAASSAFAQSERDMAFDALLRDPANIGLMLRYAQLSVAERDYEAAAATLERLVRIDPEAQEARLELALAYFALGSNEVARYHLDIYRTRGDLTEEETRAVEQYLRTAARREKKFGLSYLFEAGPFRRSSDGEAGLTYDVAVRADLDLGGANSATWQTLLRAQGKSLPGLPVDNQGSVLFRTGPIIAIDGTAFGPRLNPYLEVQRIYDNDDSDAGLGVTLGLDYSVSMESGIGLNANLSGGRVDRKGFGFDSTFVSAQIGATVQPAEGWSLGATVRYFDEDYAPGGQDKTRTGLRVASRHDLGGNFLGLEGWTLDASLLYDRETYDIGREDDVVSGGLSVRAYLRQGTYVRATVRRFERTSNLPVFDDADTTVSLTLGMEF